MRVGITRVDDSRSSGAVAANARIRSKEGFALASVVLALFVVTALITALFATTRTEVASVRSTSSSASGFYSAEAGLNIRGELIRTAFDGYTRPSGQSPDPDDACEGGNLGSNHFECIDYPMNDRDVKTYVIEDETNNDPDDSERMITIPTGERFAGLNAIQYRYSVISEAAPRNDPRPEAILEMVFRARLVPLFQFSAFYDKDLEILPGPDMTLEGPVHVNGDLYVNGANTLRIGGEISVSVHEDGTGGGLWRGRKDSNGCTGAVRVNDADDLTDPDPAIPCPERLVPQAELDPWNGRINTGLDPVTVPPVEEFNPGGLYWNQADLVVALDLRNGLNNARVIVPNRAFGGGLAGISVNGDLTDTLEDDDCGALAPRSYDVRPHPVIGGLPALPDAGDARAVEWSNSFRDRRENRLNPNARNGYRLMLEVDLQALMDCIEEEDDLLEDGPSVEEDLSDTSDGGLVFFFTVLGPFSEDASSGYGVRLRNGAFLGSTDGGAPDINGLTVISDQAIWIQGDYNRNGPGNADWRSASFMTDALNILSNNFANQWINHDAGLTDAWDTEINSAFLSGTRTTGGVNGTAGQGGAYNGGLENYPILHERWTGDTLTYLGSFVSLEEPEHSTGAWGGHHYSPPLRDWGYDTRFDDARSLPPLSPRFTYLVQERFVRDFTR